MIKLNCGLYLKYDAIKEASMLTLNLTQDYGTCGFTIVRLTMSYVPWTRRVSIKNNEVKVRVLKKEYTQHTNTYIYKYSFFNINISQRRFCVPN